MAGTHKQLVLVACMLVFLAAIVGVTATSSAQSGKKQKPTPKPVPAKQANIEEYGAKIREHTTEKFFLTDLVDHLPASDSVPSPDKVLGYAIGTPDKLTYTKDINRYMRELARTSPRVKVNAMGLSDEGREMLAVIISDEANISKLDRIRDVNSLLADPRKIKDEGSLASLLAETKPVYWISGAMHSPETGSPEMLMELAYRVAIEETPFIQNIRKNTIVMITPVIEVDGRDREVDVYRYKKENPKKVAPSLIYWGKYVAHDNNRDGMTLSLKLSQAMMKNFLEWHPVVLHDLHESVPFLYISTGMGPYNAWLDPIVVNEWQELAYNEVEEFSKRGVPGVWTQGFYDGWAPNYMFYIANGHNSIGRFYETFGGGGADTMERNVPQAQTTRAWFRPNPPLPRVKWSIRNNINLQQSGVLMAMSYVADNRERLLKNFYLKGKRSIAKATTEGPAAYVLPGDEKRPFDAADLVNVLRRQGCEIHISSETIKTKEGEFPPGSYIIRMDQPYSRMADMLLDTQYYNISDPRPYDDTGWTMGALKNVKTVRVKDTAILSAKMALLASDAKPKGVVEGTGTTTFAINNTADNNVVLLRFHYSGLKILTAEDAFEAASQKFARGSFLIAASGDAKDRLARAADELGLRVYALDASPKVATHPLALPRIAILHTWTSTQNEGWYRLAFDTLGIPYAYISDQNIRNTPDLKEKYDVIVFPPVGGSAQRIVNGLPVRGDPIPWKATDQYPNLTGPNGAQTDDMRGGMGLEGLINLKRFIEGGGLFITVGANCSLPIDYGMTEGVSVVEARQLQARGSVLNAEIVDKRSPVTYGFDDKLALYFSGAPILNLSTGLGGLGGSGGFMGLGPQAGGRETGRGGLNDPDIPQARPLFTPPKREEGEDSVPSELREMQRLYTPPEDMRPRVIIRWALEKELLLSGMLAGGSELAGKPALIDFPMGKGHILFFANNPFWRMETSGSYMLLFNAAMNFDNLTARKTALTPTEEKRPD